jgi:hypothetical protein
MNDWKEIMTFTLPQEAYMAKGYLESEGIESLVFDDLTVQVNLLYSNAIGGVKVLVRETDYEGGIEILKKGGYLNSNNGEPVSKFNVLMIDKDTDAKKCPFCQSDNIGKKKGLNIWSAIIYLILSLFVPIYKSTYCCYDCEKEWRFRKAKKQKL